jgi:CheY-like chemotaxis protein
MTCHSPSEGRASRILICDDESRLASLTAGLLEDHGYALRTVRSGEEALEVLDGPAPVGVMLLDVNLAEGMTPYELLVHLERLHRPTRVILTSGLPEEDVPSELLAHPRVWGYLPKPYSMEQLVDVVDRAAEA